MKSLDISANSRIPVLMELVNSMSTCMEPLDLIEKFVGTMRRAYGVRCYLQLSTRGLGLGQYRIHRLLAPNARELSDWPLGWRPGDDPVHRTGILSLLVAAGSPGVYHNLDLRNDPVLGENLAAYHSAAAVPLFENDLGINWVVLFDSQADAFDEDDLEDLILRANLVGALVNNLDTARKLIGASLHIQAEIDQIARIQQALLPDRIPEVPGLKIAASYQTFDRAGGDIYDIARLGNIDQDPGISDNRWGLLIGDVSGHGPAATVVMAMLHAIIRAYPIRPTGPAEVLRHANRHLCAKRIEHSFVTVFLAFYDPATRQLTYARAGHEPPILKEFPHVGSPLRLNAVGELPLGVLPDVDYREAVVALHPGQTLILYTDGIIEAGRSTGGMFGIEGIENSLIECTGAPDCAIEHITKSLMRYQAGHSAADDQTIVAIQVV